MGMKRNHQAVFVNTVCQVLCQMFSLITLLIPIIALCISTLILSSQVKNSGSERVYIFLHILQIVNGRTRALKVSSVSDFKAHVLNP